MVEKLTQIFLFSDGSFIPTSSLSYNLIWTLSARRCTIGLWDQFMTIPASNKGKGISCFWPDLCGCVTVVVPCCNSLWSGSGLVSSLLIVWDSKPACFYFGKILCPCDLYSQIWLSPFVNDHQTTHLNWGSICGWESWRLGCSLSILAFWCWTWILLKEYMTCKT